MAHVADLGVILPTMSPPDESPGDVVAAAVHAERLGFESAWVVDQLVAGTGAPFVESVVAAAAAAGATERIALGIGVMIVPLRPIAWIAKQVAALQQVSRGRLLLGVGIGGDRHDRSWAAVGVPSRERGARTDAALEVLPGLIAGDEVVLASVPGEPRVRLAPGAPVPPIVVGGMSDAAVNRTIRFGDGWFVPPLPLAAFTEARTRLAKAADDAGRPRPALTATVAVAIDGEPSLPSPTEIRRRLTDPDGMFGMPDEAVDMVLTTGDTGAVARVLQDLSDAGADRIVASIAAGDWFAQAALLAEARGLLT